MAAALVALTLMAAACGGGAAGKARATTTARSTTTTTSTTSTSAPTTTVPATTVPATTVPATTVPATTVPPLTSATYTWASETSPALDLGGGPSTTLSAVITPAANGRWLVAGSQFVPGGRSEATIWTSAGTQRWSKSVLAHPAGASSSADGATDWGARQVVVGSVGSGASMTAAAWVSPGPAGPFRASPVTTTTTTTSTSSTTTSSTTTTSTSTTTTSTTTLPVGSGGTGPPPGTTTMGATTTTSPAPAPVPSAMDHVTAGTLGLFAAGTVGGRATLWYSTNGQLWSPLASADGVIDHDTGAVINALLATPTGVFAAGQWADGDRLSAALWYSPDGIHWSAVSPGPGSFGGPGDHVITSLLEASGAGGGSAPEELVAVGGVRVGSSWQPASWISPDGFSWSQTSESFPVDNEPAGSAGALAYAASGAGNTIYAVGGSPERQRVWTSQQGLAWAALPLPAGAATDPSWHLGLVATEGATTVMADNLPGQPFVLVRQGGTWSQPSAEGIFGTPLAMAVPTSLASDNGTLFMSVDVASPGLRLGRGTGSVVVLSSSDGVNWRRANSTAWDGAMVSQLLALPQGLLAVGAQAPTGLGPQYPGSADAPGGWPAPGAVGASAFALLSTNMGATWAHSLMKPAAAGQPQASPATAVAAGRLGADQYVVGEQGNSAVAWQSPNGSLLSVAHDLDTTPRLGSETVLATCSSGASAVAVGYVSGPRYGTQPAAWSTTDGASWASSVFLPAPPQGSFSSVDGCLSTGNGFIAYGATGGKDQALAPVLWSSSDGTTWQQLSTTFVGVNGGRASGPQSSPLDWVATGTTTWLALSGGGDRPDQAWPSPVGGAAALAATEPGLWASVDAGNTWQELGTDFPAFNANYFAQAEDATYVGQQPLVAGTLDGRLEVWLGTEQPPAVP